MWCISRVQNKREVLTEMLVHSSYCFRGVGGSASQDAHGSIFPELTVTVKFLPILPPAGDR